MQDHRDRETIDFIPKEKTMKFKITYGFAVKGKLRSGALIMDAKDKKEAIAAANKELAAEHDWHQLNSVKELTSTNTQL